MKIAKMDVPQGALDLLDRLKQHGFSGHIVGGSVRDHLRGVPPRDFDMTTDATPEEMLTVFQDKRVIATGLKHGTLTVLTQDGPVEITTYREDGDYKDHRHPDKVSFTKSLREDLARRDFTVNAIAYSPEGGYTDPFGGIEDLQNRCLRAVGDPHKRFEEDALRILRGIRFSSVLGFEIDPLTQEAMYAKKHLLSFVSAERIREEITKLLLGDYATQVLLRHHEILEAVIPEITPMVACGQNSVYHIHSVWEHTARVVGYLPKNLCMRWAGLLHDMGKPSSKFVGEDGKDHFYGHPKVSGEMGDAILRRLKFDNANRSYIVSLVLHHDDRPRKNRLKLLRSLGELGEKLLFDINDFSMGDSLAQNPEHPVVQAAMDTSKEVKAYLTQLVYEEKVPYKISHLAITGDDLIAIGFPKGKQVGNCLSRLLGDLWEDRVENTKEALLARAARCYLS